MHLDPALPTVVLVVLLILLVSLVLKALRQPQIVGYLIAGVLLGPEAFAVVDDVDLVNRLGAAGLVFLLFFIGMEISPQRLASTWKVTLVGTLLQIGVTVGLVTLVGVTFEWPISRVLLIGFAASLSSTAVILKLLSDSQQLESRTGQNVLGILLTQDIAIVPMLVAIGFFGGSSLSVRQVVFQILGAIVLVGLVVMAVAKQELHVPFKVLLRRDRELQVFGALAICFGLALFSGAFYLSTALGAFVGGILVGSTRETSWFHETLDPFRILFVALFFVSVGMIIDLEFIAGHLWQIGLLVFIIFVTNTLVNAGILRVLGENGRDSLYAGAMLAQIGEFSFLLVAVGVQAEIISPFAYQLAVAVIAVTLVLSPAWISLFHHVTGGESRLDSDLEQTDVRLSLDSNFLSIQSECKIAHDEGNENCHRIERAYGVFSRTFTLPRNVVTEEVDANFKNGLLTVTLPKLEGPGRCRSRSSRFRSCYGLPLWPPV